MTRVNIIDFIARKLKALVGIVQDTDTATVNIAKGKYVIWKGNPCKASSAISSGGTLSASNLTALTEGVGNDINSKISYETIINMQQITTSYVTRNTYNGRKFSDYDLLVFTPVVNSWAKVSCIVPTWLFETYTGVDIRFYQGSNLIEVDVKRTSDTSFDAKYIGTLDTGCYVNCFGVFKLT